MAPKPVSSVGKKRKTTSSTPSKEQDQSSPSPVVKKLKRAPAPPATEVVEIGSSDSEAEDSTTISVESLLKKSPGKKAGVTITDKSKPPPSSKKNQPKPSIPSKSVPGDYPKPRPISKTKPAKEEVDDSPRTPRVRKPTAKALALGDMATEEDGNTRPTPSKKRITKKASPSPPPTLRGSSPTWDLEREEDDEEDDTLGGFIVPDGVEEDEAEDGNEGEGNEEDGNEDGDATSAPNADDQEKTSNTSETQFWEEFEQDHQGETDDQDVFTHEDWTLCEEYRYAQYEKLGVYKNLHAYDAVASVNKFGETDSTMDILSWSDISTLYAKKPAVAKSFVESLKFTSHLNYYGPGRALPSRFTAHTPPRASSTTFSSSTKHLLLASMPQDNNTPIFLVAGVVRASYLNHDFPRFHEKAPVLHGVQIATDGQFHIRAMALFGKVLGFETAICAMTSIGPLYSTKSMPKNQDGTPKSGAPHLSELPHASRPGSVSPKKKTAAAASTSTVMPKWPFTLAYDANIPVFDGRFIQDDTTGCKRPFNFSPSDIEKIPSLPPFVHTSTDKEFINNDAVAIGYTTSLYSTSRYQSFSYNIAFVIVLDLASR